MERPHHAEHLPVLLLTGAVAAVRCVPVFLRNHWVAVFAGDALVGTASDGCWQGDSPRVAGAEFSLQVRELQPFWLRYHTGPARYGESSTQSVQPCEELEPRE